MFDDRQLMIDELTGQTSDARPWVDPNPKWPKDSPYVNAHGGLTCINGHAMDAGLMECPCCGSWRPSRFLKGSGWR